MWWKQRRLKAVREKTAAFQKFKGLLLGFWAKFKLLTKNSNLNTILITKLFKMNATINIISHRHDLASYRSG